MVLLMHVLFVGAVFILDPTLDWRIHGEPWYDSLSLSLVFSSSKFGRVLLLDAEKCVLDLYSTLTELKVA
jgi:hypothetical protein